MRWSVSVLAEGDRVLTREEVVELADAVAPAGGVASGIGATHYGVQVIVEATDRADAQASATAILRDAAVTAGLPDWPTRVLEAVSEGEDEMGYLS